MANGKAIPHGWVRADAAARRIRWIEAIDYCNWLSRLNGLEAVYDFAAQEGDQPTAALAVKADHARNGDAHKFREETPHGLGSLIPPHRRCPLGTRAISGFRCFLLGEGPDRLAVRAPS
jgi:hypothetical protein